MPVVAASPAHTETGGVPVDETADHGALITGPGQLQFGPMLLGDGTPAGWLDLIGWRNLPDAAVGDSQRPQAHGSYPGSVFGESLVVTYDYLLRGTPANKQAALATIERWTPLDRVERWLAVDDGDGVWFRRARVIARTVPQGKHFTHAPLECSIQFLCADPRRYSLAEKTGDATLAAGSGGLQYALVYPLEYGVPSAGALSVTNGGSTDAPMVATFIGPLTDPVIVSEGWRLGFSLTLADGETLVVDTAAGTVLLDGTADRAYTITTHSDPVDACVLPPGSSSLTLTATTGTGRVQIAYRDARM